MDPRLELLWAPWRHTYVAAPKPPGQEEACFICAGLAASADRENLILFRSSHSVAILNRYPYNAGHVMVAPRDHKGHPRHLSRDEVLDCQELLVRCLEALDQLLRPEGYNLGLNLGRAAGAGLPGHLHWHIVPRWNGDTNFMPVIHDVKVISQSLDALWELLQEHLRRPKP